MNRLMQKSYISYLRAKQGFLSGQDDDVFLDYACYDMQQAVELYIKSKLYDCGIDVPHTHEIITLIQKAQENSIDICEVEELINFSETLTSWEARGRYTLEKIPSSLKLENIIKVFEKMALSLFLWAGGRQSAIQEKLI